MPYSTSLLWPKAVEVDITLDDFQRISDETPFIADLKPSGKYLMEDLHHVGGTPGVMKLMLAEGHLHGDCLTVTGKTIAENLEKVPDLAESPKIIHSFSEPIKTEWTPSNTLRKPSPRRSSSQNHWKRRRIL